MEDAVAPIRSPMDEGGSIRVEDLDLKDIDEEDEPLVFE